jgi:hypothetical protein
LADQQFAVAEKEGHQKQADSNNEATMECLKTAATNVFDEFIPENVIIIFMKYYKFEIFKQNLFARQNIVSGYQKLL